MELRGFIEVRPHLDFAALEPGQAATDNLRRIAADIAPKYQASVRLTGPIAMSDEEFGTIKENALRNGLITLAIVLFILWRALRSPRLILAVFVNLLLGLPFTAALGLFLVGSFNLISVYFAVLFVGIGVDFAIQYSVRYRAERHEIEDSAASHHQRGFSRRRAVDARRLRDRGGVLLLSADRLQGRLGTRPDRGLRHADRVRDQRDDPSRADQTAQPAGRTRAARL